MIIIGVLIVIVCFLLIFISPNVISFLGIPAGIFLVYIGSNRKNNRRIINSVSGVDFIGKNINDIESQIGVHTRVNLSNDDKRIYIWGNYLELLCNKDNVCTEVLKDVVNQS